MSIVVHGTAFNVRAMPDEENVDVSLLEGSVSIESEPGKKLSALVPGEQFSYNRQTKSATIRNVDVEILSAWRHNLLVFDNQPFEEVVRYLSNWYGVHITIDEELTDSHRYTFNIKSESLTEVLERISVMTPIDFKIDGENVWIKKRH